MNATFDHRESATKNMETLWFRPTSRIRYQAGQFIELYLPHDPVDNRGTKREFTLSSSPTESMIAITTKFAYKKGSSFKQVLLSLHPGDKVSITEPMGDFVLPKDITLPLVFIAIGTGITPFRSIITYLNDSGQRRNIMFFYSVGRDSEIAFESLFRNSGINPCIVVSNPSTTWQGKTGHLSAKLIMNVTNNTEGTLFYISGPASVVDSLSKEFLELGLRRSQLISDPFPGYTDLLSDLTIHD